MIDYKIDNSYYVGGQYGSLGMTNKYHRDGYWYKQNCNGTEGASEEICSKILEHSNVSDFVRYEECLINGVPGCRSKSFLDEGEAVITFHNLYKLRTGSDLNNTIMKYNSVEARVYFVLEFINKATSLDCREYLNRVLYFDMLTFNVDRHFHNLAVIKCSKGWRLAPMFDFGASFFSLKSVFPGDMAIEDKIAKMTPKPFTLDFERQANVLGNCLIKLDYDKLGSVSAEFPPDIAELLCSQLNRYKVYFSTQSMDLF